MRLDVVITAPVVGLGLSAILLEPQVASGFPLSGSCRGTGPSRRTTLPSRPIRRNGHRGDAVGQQREYMQQSQHSFIRTNNVIKQHQNDNISIRSYTRLSASISKEEEEYIDAVVEGKTAGLAVEDDGENTSAKERKRDLFKKTLRNLASLSLVDYKWRSAVFKKQEADRMEEEWMAAMMGEDPAYARPMDAGDQTRGPLGNAEKSAVQWLMSVIEEEGRRARRIADSDGELVRPKDLSLSGDAGPLSELEEKALKFISEITDSEVERVRTGTMRPKDMKTPGPLGEAEARAVLALSRIVESEKVRMDQSRMRGGEAVRPIDVPGPLGELERYVGDIIRAERQRVKDRDANEGKLVRPKDASIQSGLGNVERKAVEDWEVLRKEENERLFNLLRFLDERRPMETDADSALGVTEAFTVGLLRGPQLFWKTMGRVKELMSSEDIDGQGILIFPTSSSFITSTPTSSSATMVKYGKLLLSAVLVGSASAFAPAPFARPATGLFMSDEAPVPPPEAPPAPAAPVKTTAIVPINEETVEFTAGLLGGVVGFAVGGPVLGAVAAAAANYASKTDAEAGEVLSAVSKTSIEIFNYFSKLDSKYEVLDSAKAQLENALEKVKASDSANPETVEKIESALSSTNSKIQEINDEYDLVGTGMTALGVVGDLVEKAIIKAGELNEEYSLSSKATVALKDAVDKAKAASA